MSPPRRKKAPQSTNARRRRVPQRDFWGSDPSDDDEVEFIRPAADPTVMLRSLSSPPLPGRETVAVHYFAAVAEKAANLAVALAAASELLDMDDFDEEEDEYESA